MLSGKDQVPVTCDRSVTLQTKSNPERTEVGILVSWQFRGRAMQEELTGVIYPR